jgi:demethylmenaquinone methyltransferase/2-methoxy-6-polyprenyl-1,4-benzoquinol methylase
MQPRPTRGDDLDALLAEQISYYSARAPEYFRGAIAVDPADATAARQELLAAIAAFNPRGDVLELACGPGTWTAEILRYADSITAVDASPEMLALAAAAVGKHGAEVRFVNADLFSWEPDRLYDAVFFGFWLSHVPVERFASFWAMVERALRPGGRVMFVDDAYREDDELIEGPESSTILRRLEDGTPFRAVKVPYTPADLERRLAEIGWTFSVKPTAGPFFYGTSEGPRATSRLSGRGGRRP